MLLTIYLNNVSSARKIVTPAAESTVTLCKFSNLFIPPQTSDYPIIYFCIVCVCVCVNCGIDFLPPALPQ